MKGTTVLSLFLAISILANIGLFFIYETGPQGKMSDLVARASTLSTRNMQLERQIEATNMSLSTAQSQLDFYRSRLSLSQGSNGSGFAAGNEYASMEAPAVSQRIEYVQNGPMVTQNVISNGSIMNISVEVQPGKGRILVETKPLMGIVFQDAANTAVYVAQNKTGVDLSQSDVLFSIQADNQISSIDGPSAGALMTLLTISALSNRHINQSVTLTGTIDGYGHVGAIGGAVEKAQAAYDNGLKVFLLPEENKDLTIYSEQTADYGGFQYIEEVPAQVDAKEYIEKNVGIKVIYVNSINDVTNDVLT